MTQQTIIGIDLAKHVFQVCMVTPTGTLKTNTAVARGKLLALIRARTHFSTSQVHYQKWGTASRRSRRRYAESLSSSRSALWVRPLSLTR